MRWTWLENRRATRLGSLDNSRQELFDCTFVNLLVYLYYSVDFFYCTVLLCNLAHEFPSGLIKFYFILSSA